MATWSIVILLLQVFSALSCKAYQLPSGDQLQAKSQSKSTANNQSNVTASDLNLDGDKNDTLKGEWDLDIIESDLMDIVKKLNDKYNMTNFSEPENELYDTQEGQLTRRSDKVEEKAQVTHQGDGNVSKTQTNRSASTQRAHPTAIPVLSTSLANGEPELAESSWQYGIFDRFTRPRSTTTTQRPTTEDPQFSLEAGAKLDVRNFNTNECGLRTYEDSPYMSPEGDLTGGIDQDHYSISSLKREKSPQAEVERKKNQLESIHNLLRDRADQNSTSSSGTSSTPKREDSELGEDIFANFKEQNLDSLVPENQAANLGDNSADLVSRRNWLQQQIGNTLQKLGLNASHSTSDMLSYSSNNVRENMMKKRFNKLGRSNNDQTATSPDQKLFARQDELKLEARVIGGSNARLGDSPWSVSLQALVSRPGVGGVEYRHYCGGTIISEYYVLTAAHCLDFMVGRESRLFVVVGDINWRMNAASMYGRRFGIEKLIIHSGYKSTAFGHDIGLIKTKESMTPLKVNGKYIINSVCLPNKGVEHSGEAELVGWGLFSNRNEMADQLQIADVPVLPRPLCVDLYRRRTGLIQWLIGIELITEKQVCAGTFGRGICQGDSGSALVMNEKFSRQDRSQELQGKFFRDRGTGQMRATHIGIVAFGGIRRCSYQSLPGVYMQTSKYLDWILPRIQS